MESIKFQHLRPKHLEDVVQQEKTKCHQIFVHAPFYPLLFESNFNSNFKL